MDSQKKVPMMEDNDLQNVELHRAESMVDQKIEVLDQLKQDNNKSVISYVGNKAQSIFSRIPACNVEIVMFLYMFSYTVRSITSTSMIMAKVCTIHLGYSEYTCDHLDLEVFKSVKSEVEKMTNNYHVGHTLIQMAPSAILALFIGSWSDKYGRKPPLIFALVGIIIDGFGTIMCAHFFSSRIEFYFIPAIFTGMSGGFISVLMVLYSYTSDISTSGKRTIKYAFMELAFGLSMPLGALVGGWIFRYYKFVPVFVTSVCGHILCLLCVLFFLEETKGLDNKDNWITKFRNFWTFEAAISSFKATAKKRPNRGNLQIWLIILSMSIAIFSFASLMGIAYLYVHHRYNWENTTYSTVSAIYSVLGLTTMFVLVSISRRKKIRDPILGIVGSMSLVLKNVTTGLAYTPWIYHLANILGFFSGLGSLAGRSWISKIVPKDDLGKVFAFLTTAESIFPIAATAVVSQGYNATLDIFPGLLYVVMGVLNIIPFFIFIWISRLPVINYEEMGKEEDHDDVKIDGNEEVPTAKF